MVVVSILICVFPVIAWALVRRYRPPPYSTQRFSRTRIGSVMKSTVPPLKVPWTVAHPTYSPVCTGPTVPHEFWWFNRTFIDGRLRFLCEISPRLLTALPINPYGRTGATGLGTLQHMGANSVVFTVLRTSNGFVAQPHPTQKTRPPVRGTLIWRGYVDHPYNTDNAWVEGSIYIVEAAEATEAAEASPQVIEAIQAAADRAIAAALATQ